MDYIYERIKEASYDQEKSFPFAPYFQKLINHVVMDQKFMMDTKHKAYKPKKELSITSTKDLNSPSWPNIKTAKITMPREDDALTSPKISINDRLSLRCRDVNGSDQIR